MKQELFLTSSVHAVAHDIAQHVNLKENNKLVFIITAAEPEMSGDTTWLDNDRQALVDAGFDVTDYTITGKSREQLETDLKEYKFIYLSGGNTAHLLDQSVKSGFFDLIKDLIRDEGKVYIGTSAGSIIARPKLPDYFSDEKPELKDRTCYGFVNFIPIPHWGSEQFREEYLGERLKIVYTTNQVPFILLTDDQYVHVKDEMFNILNLNTQ